MPEAFGPSHYLISQRESLEEQLIEAVGRVRGSTVLVVVDENIPRGVFGGERLEGAGMRVCRMACGEERKQYAHVPEFIQRHQTFLDKRSVVVTVGGGSLLDFVGFCCGVMYRGVRYVTVPTSVTAMADAAYGGKTAVNLGRGGAKNQVGMYHHPLGVYVDFRLLTSLPAAHARAGAVEIAKLAFFYSAIAAAIANVEMTEGEGEVSGLAEAIVLAAKKKLELVKADPFEEGAAAVLLYGHAFSNAFEAYAWETKGVVVPHGFAVAMGICFSAFVEGRLDARFSGSMAERLKVLERLVGMREIFEQCVPETAGEMRELLERDKYAANGSMWIPAALGRGGYREAPLDMVCTEFEAWRGERELSTNGHE